MMNTPWYLGKYSQYIGLDPKKTVEGPLIAHDSVWVRTSKVEYHNGAGWGGYYSWVELHGLGKIIARLYIWMFNKLYEDK